MAVYPDASFLAAAPLEGGLTFWRSPKISPKFSSTNFSSFSSPPQVPDQSSYRQQLLATSAAAVGGVIYTLEFAPPKNRPSTDEICYVLYGASQDGYVRRWELDVSLQQLFQTEKFFVGSRPTLAISDDSRWLCAAAHSGYLSVGDLDSPTFSPVCIRLSQPQPAVCLENKAATQRLSLSVHALTHRRAYDQRTKTSASFNSSGRRTDSQNKDYSEAALDDDGRGGGGNELLLRETATDCCADARSSSSSSPCVSTDGLLICLGSACNGLTVWKVLFHTSQHSQPCATSRHPALPVCHQAGIWHTHHHATSGDDTVGGNKIDNSIFDRDEAERTEEKKGPANLQGGRAVDKLVLRAELLHHMAGPIYSLCVTTFKPISGLSHLLPSPDLDCSNCTNDETADRRLRSSLSRQKKQEEQEGGVLLGCTESAGRVILTLLLPRIVDVCARTHKADKEDTSCQMLVMSLCAVDLQSMQAKASALQWLGRSDWLERRRAHIRQNCSKRRSKQWVGRDDQWAYNFLAVGTDTGRILLMCVEGGRGASSQQAVSNEVTTRRVADDTMFTAECIWMFDCWSNHPVDSIITAANTEPSLNRRDTSILHLFCVSVDSGLLASLVQSSTTVEGSAERTSCGGDGARYLGHEECGRVSFRSLLNDDRPRKSTEPKTEVYVVGPIELELLSILPLTLSPFDYTLPTKQSNLLTDSFATAGHCFTKASLPPSPGPTVDAPKTSSPKAVSSTVTTERCDSSSYLMSQPTPISSLGVSSRPPSTSRGRRTSQQQRRPPVQHVQPVMPRVMSRYDSHQELGPQHSRRRVLRPADVRALRGPNRGKAPPNGTAAASPPYLSSGQSAPPFHVDNNQDIMPFAHSTSKQGSGSSCTAMCCSRQHVRQCVKPKRRTSRPSGTDRVKELYEAECQRTCRAHNCNITHGTMGPTQEHAPPVGMTSFNAFESTGCGGRRLPVEQIKGGTYEECTCAARTAEQAEVAECPTVLKERVPFLRVALAAKERISVRKGFQYPCLSNDDDNMQSTNTQSSIEASAVGSIWSHRQTFGQATGLKKNMEEARWQDEVCTDPAAAMAARTRMCGQGWPRVAENVLANFWEEKQVCHEPADSKPVWDDGFTGCIHGANHRIPTALR
eukprot:GHVS01021210.1.p1 GENE.GHVS01021210.1~~GHVS01021210.1.p1  ORF type:complete len:1173 (-),score=165.40 GHVS01021210.1:285-3683(-)